MPSIQLRPRILFLSTDASIVESQLEGRDFALSEAGTLRDDVSTDEITPVPILTHYDHALGRYPYTGFKAGAKRPIKVNAVRLGGFTVTVAGKRYGNGSSREHSPTAEKLAGIRLVIAESFERIYRQNADNIGLFTSTDFGLIDRIKASEAIDVEELVSGRDKLAADILRAGGLLAYGQQFMSHVASSSPRGDTRPRTLFEKIVARHALVSASHEWPSRPPDVEASAFAVWTRPMCWLHRGCGDRSSTKWLPNIPT